MAEAAQEPGAFLLRLGQEALPEVLLSSLEHGRSFVGPVLLNGCVALAPATRRLIKASRENLQICAQADGTGVLASE